MKLKRSLCLVVLVLISFFLVGCNSKKEERKLENEIETSLEWDFQEPDVYFESALNFVSNEDYESAAEELTEAISYIASLTFDEDTLNSDILDFAMEDLESLKEEILTGELTDTNLLSLAFAEIDKSIIVYHQAILEDFYWNGGENREGLELLYRILVRLDYSAMYLENELPNEFQTQLEELKREILGSEKSSPRLAKSVNELIKSIHKLGQKETKRPGLEDHR